MVQRAGGESAEGEGRRDINEFAAEGIGVGSHLAALGLDGIAHSQHLFDGPNPRDRFLGEVECQRHRAQQASVDVNRAAAHALHDARFLQRTTGKARQDDRLPGSHVFEHAQDFHLKILDLIALKDGFPNGVLAGAHIAQGVDGHLPGCQLRPNTSRENE